MGIVTNIKIISIRFREILKCSYPYIKVLLYSAIEAALRALFSGQLQGLQGGWHDFLAGPPYLICTNNCPDAQQSTYMALQMFGRL